MSETGSHRYTEMYLLNHIANEPCNPSHVAKANTIGPSIDSTTRKKVRIVSMISPVASNIISSKERNPSDIALLVLYMALL